jgi:hypothetical protein
MDTRTGSSRLESTLVDGVASIVVSFIAAASWLFDSLYVALMMCRYSKT